MGNILYLNDQDPLSCLSIGLGVAGHTVASFTDDTAALASLATPPDLIYLKVCARDGGLDAGARFLRELLNNPTYESYRHIPRIGVICCNNPPTLREDQFTRVYELPVSLDQLTSGIEQLLR
jgi:hypothetical protein